MVCSEAWLWFLIRPLCTCSQVRLPRFDQRADPGRPLRSTSTSLSRFPALLRDMPTEVSRILGTHFYHSTPQTVWVWRAHMTRSDMNSAAAHLDFCRLLDLYALTLTSLQVEMRRGCRLGTYAYLTSHCGAQLLDSVCPLSHNRAYRLPCSAGAFGNQEEIFYCTNRLLSCRAFWPAHSCLPLSQFL